MFRINQHAKSLQENDNIKTNNKHTHQWACGELPPRNNCPQQVVGSPYLSTKEECDLKRECCALFLGEQVDSIVVSNNIIIRNGLKRFRGLIYFFFYCHLTCKGGHFPDSHVETTSFRRRTKKFPIGLTF